MLRTLFTLVVLAGAFPLAADAQFATVGGGVLLADRLREPVAELHAETPPFLQSRAYFTLSWTDESASPTVITAAERSLLRGKVMLGLGAGLLWLEPNDYKPYPILVSTTIVPLPIPRTAVLAIASTQPFQEFEWSLVLKVGVTFWFVK